MLLSKLELRSPCEQPRDHIGGQMPGIKEGGARGAPTPGIFSSL